MIFPLVQWNERFASASPRSSPEKNMHPGKSVKSNMKSKYDELVRIFISIFAAKKTCWLEFKADQESSSLW